MKRTILSLLLLSAFVCGATAQNDAMYVYRNDGEFNAFLKADIDSIAQSHYDADSVYHADWQMQIIYTQDSIYKIPLAAIDSVSLVQPETIFQPNVVRMEQMGLMDYLQAVDGMSLLFKTTIPRDLQPQAGEVLLCTDFDSPLLENGFAGKVQSTKLTSEAFRVDCDSIYDIFEIFEQLISIERIVDEGSSSRRRADGEWISNRNALNFNLGYSRHLSDGEVSLSGSVDGTYIATVTYNITRKEQYIKLKIDHDWQYGAHLNFKKELGSFGTLVGPVASLPAMRFPAVAPVFKFQIAGCPFVKGEGNMELDFSLSSPVHSYIAEAVYRNGHFSGWNHKKPTHGSNTPNVEAAFSLNGSVQAGYMVDLWLGLDIFGSVCKVGTGLDFYIGPKLSGDFSMKIGSENPVNYYSIYKDSKIGIDWLHVDYEFFGTASLAGHKFPKAMFCEGSLQSPLNHEWYIMPEFSDLSVEKDSENKQATISTTPSRDILFSLSVGMGLYNSDGNLLSTKYESKNYKRENEGFEIKQTFSSLETGKKYTAKPFIRFLGGEVPALPIETFELEGESYLTCPDNNHPHAIDLGLPSGTKWCCCNVGATTPEGYGGYYAWGETSEKSVFNHINYSYYNGQDTNGDGWIDSNLSIVNIGSDIAGTSYDAATVNMGDSWRMPTRNQQDELRSKCSRQWTTQNGVNGILVTGPSGGKIFLPAAGFRDDNLNRVGSYGDCWSSSLDMYENFNAHNLYFTSEGWNWDCWQARFSGHTIRAVKEP